MQKSVKRGSGSLAAACAALALSAGLACAGESLAAGDVIGKVRPTSIYLRAGTIDASTRRANVASLAGREGRFVIQLDGPMTPERRRALEAAGVRLGDYLPVNTWIARLDNARTDSLAGLTFVRWHAPFDNAWKLAPDLGRRSFKGNDRLFLAGLGKLLVHVDIFRDADVQTAIDDIHAIDGADVIFSGNIGDQAQLAVTIPAAAAARLAQVDGVQFVEDAPEVSLRNNSTRWILQTNITNNNKLYDMGLHGENQVLGHIDGRPNLNHCSLKDPEGDPVGPNHRKCVAYNAPQSSDFHGTHTAATGVGDNGIMDNTRGMAYLARFAFDDIPGGGETGLYNTFVQHEGQGATVHTNSWGNDGTTAYDGWCRAIDRFSYNFEDNLVCFAVTNLSTLKNPENAKNVLAVGASQDANNQANHCSGGQGPTSDGRRKPEIYAPGCNTSSALNSSSCSTTTATGTSMASPAIAGMGLLVRQYYTDGFYPSGAANASDSFIPSGALIKATLINGSVDMTGVTGYPSNREGWGRLVADTALFFAGDTRTLWTYDLWNASGLSTGQTNEFSIEVGGSGEQLRVTMCFTDPAANSGASFAAINDLDLEVVDPAGNIYKGNVFSSGVSVTGGTKDDRNNLEQVHLNNPTVGTWTVRVRGAAVNQNLQGYALAVSGIVTQSNPCPGDYNGDGTVNTLDVLAFLNDWSAGTGGADFNNDGTVNTLDVLAFLNAWSAGC